MFICIFSFPVSAFVYVKSREQCQGSTSPESDLSVVFQVQRPYFTVLLSLYHLSEVGRDGLLMKRRVASYLQLRYDLGRLGTTKLVLVHKLSNFVVSSSCSLKDPHLGMYFQGYASSPNYNE